MYACIHETGGGFFEGCAGRRVAIRFSRPTPTSHSRMVFASTASGDFATAKANPRLHYFVPANGAPRRVRWHHRLGCCYPTDLSDAQWNYLEPHLPAPNGRGRPRTHDLREILNAVFYLLKSGCQ
jgi:hypothetical protein